MRVDHQRQLRALDEFSYGVCRSIPGLRLRRAVLLAA